MSAEKIVPLSASLYITLWLVAPLTILYPYSSFSVFMLAGMFLCIQTGVLSAQAAGYKSRPMHVPQPSPSPLQFNARKIFRLILTLALFGICLRLIDKIFIRDILSYTSAVARRDADSSASIFGVISAPLYMLLITLPAFAGYFRWRLLKKILVVALFLIPSVEVIFMGSRGIFVTSFFMLLIYTSVLFKLKLRHLAMFTVLGLAAFYISGIIFVERISTYGFSPAYSAQNSVYAFTLAPNSLSMRLIQDPGLFGIWGFLLINFLQYVLHGFLEFTYLLNNFNADFQFGAYTFRVIGKVFGTFVDSGSVTPRPGVYTTLLGPLWIDFGVVSLFFCFGWGWMMAYTYHKVCLGLYHYLPLYAYMATVAFFAPVVNLIQNALGVYILVSTISLILLFKLRGILIKTFTSAHHHISP